MVLALFSFLALPGVGTAGSGCSRPKVVKAVLVGWG